LKGERWEGANRNGNDFMKVSFGGGETEKGHAKKDEDTGKKV